MPEIESLRGEAHEEQVLAVALHAPSGLVVSSCGTPSYTVAYEPGPYRATVKLWKLAPTEEPLGLLPALSLAGELTHTLERHTGAVRKLLLLGAPAQGDAPPTHVASGGADGTVVVWSVCEGRFVRTLAAALDAGGGQPPSQIEVVGLALLPGPGCQVGEAGGELLLSADASFCLHVWDWRAGTLLRTLRSFNSVAGFYHSSVSNTNDALSSIALLASWYLSGATARCIGQFPRMDRPCAGLLYAPKSRARAAQVSYEGPRPARTKSVNSPHAPHPGTPRVACWRLARPTARWCS